MRTRATDDCGIPDLSPRESRLTNDNFYEAIDDLQLVEYRAHAEGTYESTTLSQNKEGEDTNYQRVQTNSVAESRAETPNGFESNGASDLNDSDESSGLDSAHQYYLSPVMPKGTDTTTE